MSGTVGTAWDGQYSREVYIHIPEETFNRVQAKREPAPIPEGAMRVAPGTDAIVWRIHPNHCGEL